MHNDQDKNRVFAFVVLMLGVLFKVAFYVTVMAGTAFLILVLFGWIALKIVYILL